MKNQFKLLFLGAFTLFATTQFSQAQLSTPGGLVNGTTGGNPINVGIRTDTPQEELHINGDLRINDVGGATSISTGEDDRLNIHLNTSAFNSSSWIEMWGAQNNGQLSLAGGQINFLFGSSTTGIGQTGMLLDNNGNVVIGDALNINTPTGYRLYVGEGILTERLRVAVVNSAQWADKVFESDYALRPLSEVEDFVQKNKHLPGVPSASEVVKDGIDVATMDATLLQQIEELWLHVIDLKKENDALKTRLSNVE